MTSAADHFHEGTHRLHDGDAAAAEAAFRTALALDPDLAEAHGNLAYLLDRNGRREEAESHYRAALDLAPEQTQSWINYGVMLLADKRFADGESALRRALALDPVNLSAWSNLGALLACQQREEEAESCYRHALDLDPDHRNAAFNLAYLLLRQGRLEEGWLRLERRDWYAVLARHLPFPRWQGEDLAGKSLLIAIEAGHGDMIQFCRYAALAKAAGARRVGVLCHPGLAILFARLDGCDLAVPLDQPLPDADFDFWVPPLSLPYFFGTRLDTIPAALPYLHPDPDRVARWAPLLDVPGRPLKVGLVWKGSVGFENDADRSLPSLALLARLGGVPGVRFFSLQKGAGEDEAAAPPPGLNLTVLGDRLEDFADTAAVIAGLDLVIAVDTAVAHLAGALGLPCWLLLPWYRADWRWLKEREDSPWYPGVMRLFRQPAMEDWDTVVTRVEAALRERAKAPGSP